MTVKTETNIFDESLGDNPVNGMELVAFLDLPKKYKGDKYLKNLGLGFYSAINKMFKSELTNAEYFESINQFRRNEIKNETITTTRILINNSEYKWVADTKESFAIEYLIVVWAAIYEIKNNKSLNSLLKDN